MLYRWWLLNLMFINIHTQKRLLIVSIVLVSAKNCVQSLEFIESVSPLFLFYYCRIDIIKESGLPSQFMAKLDFDITSFLCKANIMLSLLIRPGLLFINSGLIFPLLAALFSYLVNFSFSSWCQVGGDLESDVIWISFHQSQLDSCTCMLADK